MPFFLLPLLVLVPSGLHDVKGQPIGLVCLSPSPSSFCPAAPVTISSQNGSQMNVAVVLQGSDAISGFDITLKANHTILRPVDANAAGSLISGGTTILKCIGGVLKAGPMCPSTDTADTIHLALIGPAGFLTASPITGLLFTAVYNVTGTASTPITYQTGCSPSSVNGTTTCVVMANGTLSNPQETIQGATFTLAPVPTFAIGVSNIQSTITIVKGQTGSSTIQLSSINGFSGIVALSLNMSPTTKHPPTISLSSNSVTLTSGGSATDLLTASAGNNVDRLAYTITVTGTTGNQSASVQVELIVTSR